MTTGTASISIAGILLAAAVPFAGAAPSDAAKTEPQAASARARTLDPLQGGHVSEGDPRSPVVMPAQRIDIEFSHQTHVDSLGFTCTECHEAASRSTRTKDFLVPDRDFCMDCHDDVEVPWRWSGKWKREENAISMPPAHLHFSHARHLEIDGVDCATCHPGVEAQDLATRENLPSMETCLTCHDGATAPGACDTCHVSGGRAPVRTRFASGLLVPDGHGPDWLKQHEVAAERDLEQCASCHAQEDCISCHDGVLPPAFHDGDYLALHVQDAYANNPPCASCHRAETFCADCHFRSGVVVGNPLRPRFDGNFHPPGWNDFDVGRAEHHSFVARKNLAACASCHEPERDCVGCHAWFPVAAASTHGPGFASSDRARRLRDANLDLCLHCHSLADPTDPINSMP